MENIMKKLDEIAAIRYECIGDWIWVNGDTKPHREILKALGGRWSPKRSLWYFRPDTSKNRRGRSKLDMDGLRAKYGTA